MPGEPKGTQKSPPQPGDGAPAPEGKKGANEALDQFKQGVKLLRDHYPSNALPYLRRAAELEQNNPYYLSFLGVAVAQALSRWTEAEVLCKKALELKHNEAQLYVNLMDVYEAAGRKKKAVEIANRGLQNTGRNPLLVKALNQLKQRRVPVLPFLGRSHPVNRQLGKLRHKILGPVKDE